MEQTDDITPETEYTEKMKGKSINPNESHSDSCKPLSDQLCKFYYIIAINSIIYSKTNKRY
jgi:hypothetical protein